MQAQTSEIHIPQMLSAFLSAQDEKLIFERNAMMLYPYIKNGTISHGKAAEILGVSKFKLINLYSQYGIDYFDCTADELYSDLSALKNLKVK